MTLELHLRIQSQPVFTPLHSSKDCFLTNAGNLHIYVELWEWCILLYLVLPLSLKIVLNRIRSFVFLPILVWFRVARSCLFHVLELLSS